MCTKRLNKQTNQTELAKVYNLGLRLKICAVQYMEFEMGWPLTYLKKPKWAQIQ